MSYRANGTRANSHRANGNRADVVAPRETSYVLKRERNIICITERGKHHLY